MCRLQSSAVMGSGSLKLPTPGGVSLYVVVVGAAIWAKVAQLAPWHRSTMYPVTPTLSVDAVQLRLIWLPLTAAVRFAGAVGGCVSKTAEGVRNATICMIQLSEGLIGAVAV